MNPIKKSLLILFKLRPHFTHFWKLLGNCAMDKATAILAGVAVSGILVLLSGTHFFRCHSISFNYSNQSLMGYYCPIVNANKSNPERYDGSKNGTLGKHDVYRDWITLSGFSSGGTFAQQLQISYSSLFSGIAVFSHAYYRCGPGDGVQDNYDNACTLVGPMTNPYNPDRAIEDIETYRQQGLIDDPINLRNKRLYVFAGTRSSFFSIAASLGILRVYEPLIQNTCAIRTHIQEAETVLPTNTFGGPCSQDAQANFFIANCGFSGALEALNFLVGSGIRAPPENAPADVSNLLAFDQTEFFYGISGEGRHDMDDIGYMYFPKACQFKKCILHFYFHGCFNGREFNGTNHIVNSGFLEVAETNDIIMVFPQARSSLPQNEIGCWDTYGITGPLYATQRGGQVTVVRNMLSRILGDDNLQTAQTTELQNNEVASWVTYSATPETQTIQTVQTYQLDV